MVTIEVNGTPKHVDIEPDTPLCGCCGTRRPDRHEIRLRHSTMRRLHGPCRRQADALVLGADRRADGAKVTTIEGLSSDNNHPVQRAWIAEDVPQCGYCQSGQIDGHGGLLKDYPSPTDADIDANITNICRCGTYELCAAPFIAPPT